jgi:hypothetical protein
MSLTVDCNKQVLCKRVLTGVYTCIILLLRFKVRTFSETFLFLHFASVDI